MTGVFEDRLLRPRQAHHGGPWPGPGRCILERDLILDLVRAHPGIALGEAEVLGRAPVVAFRREVRRLDHQRVPLPPAARVPVELSNPLVYVRPAIKWNDADIVNHLGVDSDVIRCLRDLIVAVVSRPEPPPPGHAIRDAPDLRPHILRPVGGPAPPRGRRRLPLLTLGGHRWHSAIRRVGNQRRPIVEVALHHPSGAVVARAAIKRLDLFDVLQGRLEHPVAKGRIPPGLMMPARRLAQCGHLLVREFGPVGERFGPLQGGRAVVRPDALQIRIPVRSARRRPPIGDSLRANRHLCERQNGEHRDRRRDSASLHQTIPPT